MITLPLAMAFAIASGAKPEQGIYTAIIAGLATSLLGRTCVQLHIETVVMRLARVPFMDATGMHTLAEIIERFQRRRIRVMPCEVH